LPADTPAADPSVADAKTRDYDVVILGATGFTGELTAAYLAEHAPAGLRWALAGRNRGKLESVRARLAKIDPALTELALLGAFAYVPELLFYMRRMPDAGDWVRYASKLNKRLTPWSAAALCSSSASVKLAT